MHAFSCRESPLASYVQMVTQQLVCCTVLRSHTSDGYCARITGCEWLTDSGGRGGRGLWGGKEAVAVVGEKRLACGMHWACKWYCIGGLYFVLGCVRRLRGGGKGSMHWWLVDIVHARLDVNGG